MMLDRCAGTRAFVSRRVIVKRGVTLGELINQCAESWPVLRPHHPPKPEDLSLVHKGAVLSRNITVENAGLFHILRDTRVKRKISAC